MYWRAAQRRMVMTQLEDMIIAGKHESSSDSIDELVDEPIREIPYDLYKALANGDPSNLVTCAYANA